MTACQTVSHDTLASKLRARALRYRFAPVCAGVAMLALAQPLSAQSAQKFGVQMAVLSTSIPVGAGGTAIGGFGVEPQLRYNRLYSNNVIGVSLGAGGQYTMHTSGTQRLNISGVFLEPRIIPRGLVIGRFYPYLAGRLALLRQSSNFGSSSSGTAFGAGGGFAIRLKSRVNIDAGVALVRQKFGDFVFKSDGASASFNPFSSYAAKVGVSYGFPVRKEVE